jgi:hypothetical protein
MECPFLKRDVSSDTGNNPHKFTIGLTRANFRRKISPASIFMVLVLALVLVQDFVRLVLLRREYVGGLTQSINAKAT